MLLLNFLSLCSSDCFTTDCNSMVSELNENLVMVRIICFYYPGLFCISNVCVNVINYCVLFGCCCVNQLLCISVITQVTYCLVIVW